MASVVKGLSVVINMLDAGSIISAHSIFLLWGVLHKAWPYVGLLTLWPQGHCSRILWSFRCCAPELVAYSPCLPSLPGYLDRFQCLVVSG